MRIFRPILSLIVSLSAIVGVNAQGNGPTQPEVATFTPAGTSDMVDPATGDFNYSIPLFDVGGYPVTISYNAGRSMDEQASSVGLGWNLNIGQVTRNMRGIPDDFMGDEIKRTLNIKDNITVGAGAGLGGKILSFPVDEAGAVTDTLDLGSLGFSVGAYYNNYTGVGLSAGVSISAHLIKGIKPGLNFSLTNDSQAGNTVGAGISMELGSLSKVSAGFGYNSIDGMQGFNLGFSQTSKKNTTVKNKDGEFIKAQGSMGFGASYSFGSISFSPYSPYRYRSMNISGSFKMGLSLFGGTGYADFNGYYRRQSLASHYDSRRAYGTMYHHLATSNDMVDVNREKDGEMSEARKNMAIPILTNDLFSVSGHGFSGMFQLKRGDVPVLFDPQNEEVSGGANLGVDVSGGNIVNGAFSVEVPIVSNVSGGMFAGLHTNNINKQESSTLYYEPSYFKYAGEVSLGDEFFKRVTTDNKNTCNSINRNEREYRSTVVYHLTAEQASLYGTQKKILSYEKLNGFGDPVKVTEIDRFGTGNQDYRKKHHISEIIVVKDGGLKYVYGLPAYNISQTDYQYATKGRPLVGSDCITIDPNEMSIANPEGDDNFYEKTETPAYAHSFLLTAVLSPDYRDLGEDGPTSDDIGTYTRFNYTLQYDDFYWATPETPGKAEYNEGFYAKDGDQKAVLIRGKKEVWYIHSIESKEDVAFFTYDDRKDVFSSSTSKPLKKLDKINVFGLVEFKASTTSVPAIPKKVVNFGYSAPPPANPLYPNSPTGSGGFSDKLTLTKLYFTYEKSLKGEFSPYKFEYNTSPSYARMASNQWGGYKIPAATYEGKIMPYIDQLASDAKAKEDLYAGYGNLNKITLPSGGYIEVEYESDDYAYVQNKPAMNFFKIKGFASLVGDPATKDTRGKYVVVDLPTGIKTADDFKKYCLQNNLLASVTGSQGAGNQRDYVLLKTKTGLGGVRPNNTSPEKWEWLTSYGLINSVSVVNGNSLAYIELVENPIKKSTYDFVKKNMLKELNSIGTDLKSLSLAAMKTLLGVIGDIGKSLDGRIGDKGGVGATVDLANSYIRLTTPLLTTTTTPAVSRLGKLGGGYRVKAIQINDNFDKMVAKQFASTYRTEYSYTTTENGRTISSGVASYEPLSANEENPWKQPVFGTGRVGRRDYMETPFGESFLAAPTIAYSKVTVRSVPVLETGAASTDKVTKHAPGYSVHEFYTAKDFPVRFVTGGSSYSPDKRTGMNASPFYDYSVELARATQGFSVIMNNMHGQMKKVSAYSNSGILTSYTWNKYQTKTVGRATNAADMFGDLENTVTTINRFGNTSTTTLGVEIDNFIDIRRSISKVQTPGVVVDNTLFTIGLPVGVLFPYGKYSYHYTEYKGATNSKIIRQNGILKETEAFDLGSKVTTKNLAYAAETGALLLTETQNEFNDPLYSFTVPAYWAYRRMGGAYQNILAKLGEPRVDIKVEFYPKFAIRLEWFYGITVTDGILSNLSVSSGRNGVITPTGSYSDFLVPGDQLAGTNMSGTAVKLWVTAVSSNGISVTNNGGSLASDLDFNLRNLTVISSGFKNMTNTPIQTITSLVNPIQNGRLVLDKSTKIIEAKASDFSDFWNGYCSDCFFFKGNDHFLNILGQWRLKSSYVYGTHQRVQETPENGVTPPKVNIRRDGHYPDFSPFWVLPATGSTGLCTPTTNIAKAEDGGTNKWIKANEITKYDYEGNVVESKNALGILSSQLSGYLNRKTVAVSGNAGSNEIFYEGFEDFEYNATVGGKVNCDRHFPLLPTGTLPLMSTEQPNMPRKAHTGKKALIVKPSTSIKFAIQKTCRQ